MAKRSTPARAATRGGRAARVFADVRASAPRLTRPRVSTHAVLNRVGDQFDEIDLAAAVARNSTEVGASGTPNFGGWITGEDYNPLLDGHHGIRTWDEMRRSCSPANAACLVIDKPILSATFRAVAPKNGDTQDQAIADAVNAALFDDDAMEDPWQRTLRHFLLRHPMGFSLFEKVWQLDDAGMLRPRRLAPRLPHTVQRWIPGPNGSLKAVEQLAIKDEQYQRLTIPAEYALVSVHQREGDNYWGRSVFRSAYMHWFYLTKFYRIDAVRLFRYGVGIPNAKLSQGHTETTASLRKIERILKGMQSHDRSWLISPPGVEFDIVVPKGDGGRGGANGLLESVRHHADMIMLSVLAAFMFSGGGEGLGTNRTKELLGLFTSMLEAEAMDICADLKRGVVREICDLNFIMTRRPYPNIVATDVTAVDMKELSEELKTLVDGSIVSVDDGIEDVVRRLLRLPAMPSYLRGKREERANQPPPTPSDPSGDPGGGGGDPGGPGTGAGGKKPTSEKDPATEQKIRDKATSARTLSYTDPDSGQIFAREPTQLERSVFDLRAVPNRLADAALTLQASLAEIRRDQLETLADRIAKKDARTSTGAFTDIRPDEFTIPRKTDTVRAIRLAQADVAKYGAMQVLRELRAQGVKVSLTTSTGDGWLLDDRAYDRARLDLAKKKTGGITHEGANPTAGASKQKATSAITSSAKVAGERLNDEWFNRVMDRAVQLRRTGLQGDELKAALVAALEDEVAAQGLLASARAEVNEAFSLGRATEAAAQKASIEKVVYSALLDQDCCDPCTTLDGEEMTFESARYFETMPPYVGCDGNKGRADACRCVHLFIGK
jgi:hypothetical protein